MCSEINQEVKLDVKETECWRGVARADIVIILVVFGRALEPPVSRSLCATNNRIELERIRRSFAVIE
jgi:hypothetical protein